MANIDLFAISDLCPDGGRPSFEKLSVIVYSELVNEESIIYDVDLLYDCEFPGCCFIPGGENISKLRKKIKISKSSFEVIN